jgi:hypothetical protein
MLASVDDAMQSQPASPPSACSEVFGHNHGHNGVATPADVALVGWRALVL